MEKVLLFLTCITSFRQNVCKLSKLILANNQSLATLWPWHMSHCWTPALTIILMTASLSSKMYNWDSPWEECAFAGTWFNYDNCWKSRFPYGLVLDGLNEQSPVSYLFPNPGLVSVLALCVERNTSITTSHKSRAGNPSVRNPASNEVISDSVELWDTDVCFLHIQLKETTCTTSECT